MKKSLKIKKNTAKNAQTVTAVDAFHYFLTLSFTSAL